MKNREIFERVKAFLLQQNKKSWSGPADMCQYRAPDGCKCAVGCLIAEEHYSPELEGTGNVRVARAVQAAVAASLGVEKLSGSCISLLVALQSIHDKEDEFEWAASLARYDYGRDNADILDSEVSA